MRTPFSSRQRRASLLALAAALAACGGDNNPTGSGNTVAAYITQARSADGSVTATYHSGSPPGGSGATAVDAHIVGSVIVGGSSQLDVSSATGFSTVIIAVDGVPGYYELDGLTAATSHQEPAVSAQGGTTSATIVVTIAQTPPSNTFTIRTAAGADAGSVGSYASTGVSLVTVGTGDVQVSISWDAASDVDLHVVEPSGEEIYYGHAQSATGGKLDLDSNAGCVIDNKDNENITWPTGQAPHGTYSVRVDYFDACGIAQTKWVVTVQKKGSDAKTFSGTFTDGGDRGAAGAGREITSFTF